MAEIPADVMNLVIMADVANSPGNTPLDLSTDNIIKKEETDSPTDQPQHTIKKEEIDSPTDQLQHTEDDENDAKVPDYEESKNDEERKCDTSPVEYKESPAEFIIKALANCHNFSCSLEGLSKYSGFEIGAIESLAKTNPRTFSLQGGKLNLKPELKVCKNHCSFQGCRNKESCEFLHICQEYISKKCNSSSCIYGHRFHTNHNLKILKEFCFENLYSFVLSRILHTFQMMTHSSIDICENYNGHGCQTMNCELLHICSVFFSHLVNSGVTCDNNCSLSHDLLSLQCTQVLSAHRISINESPRDIALAVLSANPNVFTESKRALKRKLSETAESCQSVWSHFLEGNISIVAICHNSVISRCPAEESGCQKLHSPTHYHWQISEDGKNWFNLRLQQVNCLERAYCNPAMDSVILPRLDLAALDSFLKGLFLIMGRDTWYADFYYMNCENSQKTRKLFLRRLSTDYSNSTDVNIKPSKFVWYFLDANNMWVRYGSVDSRGNEPLKSEVSSDDIEVAYKANPVGCMDFKNSKFNYKIDFRLMCQRNQQTNTIRMIKRRPEPHLQETSMEDLPEDWKVEFPVRPLQRVVLDENEPQYKKVSDLFNQKLFQVKWMRIERIQNVFLWRAYQNKKKELHAKYGNDSDVNERYLFHGMTADKVNKICHENFDWRLHGSNVGQAFGRGTYFATDPLIAANYAKPDAFGHRYIFVALVAVGRKFVGDPSMVRPPQDQITNLYFDSTSNPEGTIIVKYDKQEYYPQFLVCFI